MSLIRRVRERSLDYECCSAGGLCCDLRAVEGTNFCWECSLLMDWTLEFRACWKTILKAFCLWKMTLWLPKFWKTLTLMKHLSCTVSSHTCCKILLLCGIPCPALQLGSEMFPKSQVWQCNPVIPILREVEEGGLKIQASLGNYVS